MKIFALLLHVYILNRVRISSPAMRLPIFEYIKILCHQGLDAS